MENISDIVAIVISLFAFCFSIYVHFENKKNKDQIEEQKIELYKLTIDKEKETLEFKKKAKLNIQTKTIEGNQHKLTIKNNGKNTATNVRLNILLHEEAKTKLFREMYSILPATIPSGNEITFKYRTMSQAHLKVFNAKLMWDDEFQRDNKEKITISQ